MNKMGEIFAQVAYAERLAKLYNQEIALYYNGSYKNFKSYYEEILMPSGILQNYNFVETYPFSEPVLFEEDEEFEQNVAEKGQNGEDIVIEGTFYYTLPEIIYDDFKAKFQPAQELVDYMHNTFGMTENSLYIDAEPLSPDRKKEFALAGLILEHEISKFRNKTFDKIFVKTGWPEFFMTAGFEEILGVNDIVYVAPADIPEIYRDAADIMFPYLCGSSIISNRVSSWWGHALNKFPNHEIGLLFPEGEIHFVPNAPDGISEQVITDALMYWDDLDMAEKAKIHNGEPSVYDGIYFEKELENETLVDSGSTINEEENVNQDESE